MASDDTPTAHTKPLPIVDLGDRLVLTEVLGAGTFTEGGVAHEFEVQRSLPAGSVIVSVAGSRYLVEMQDIVKAVLNEVVPRQGATNGG